MKAHLATLLLAHGRAAGVDVDALLERLSLSQALSSRPEIEIEVEGLNALFDAMAEALGDPHLGLHLALRYPRGTYKMLEFSCRNAPNLRGSFLRLVRYAGLLNGSAFVYLETGTSGALSHRLEGLGRHASEFTVAMIYLMSRELTRRAWTPDAVWFAHEAPTETGELAALFGTDKIRFGEDSNGFLIDRAALEAPIANADPVLLRVLETEIERQISAREPPTSTEIVANTERAVRMTLELGPPRIEKVAQSLSLSVRTLQRRLDMHGTSFHRLVEQVREKLARHHAQEGELSTTDMTFLLGYADVTSFLRAFRRWTGTSPQNYRRGTRAAPTFTG